MSKKTLAIIIIAVASALTVSALFGGLLLYKWIFPGDYKVGAEEIALNVKLDLEEDIGLLVYDYTIGDRNFSGGISNADRSDIRRDDLMIILWTKDLLVRDQGIDPQAERFKITIRFRIIKEYTDPNFDNTYPEEITCYLEPFSWEAAFGTAYTVVITGSKTGGYTSTIPAVTEDKQ